MICLSCATLRDRGWRQRCPACDGPLVAADDAGLERLFDERLRRQLATWRDDGLLDEATAAQLEATLPETPPPPAPVAWEAAADRFAAALPTADALRPAWLDALREALRPRPAHEPDDADGHGDDQGHAAGTANALLHHEGPEPLGGLDAVAALDASPGLRPLLNEYVWWFIGTLLVLGGSVMGVREAWRALAGVPRLLVVAGALLCYHAGFVGLAALVARRSASAGRVLGAIALGLLPVAFAALSALVALHAGVGLAASAVAAAAAGLSLRGLAGRFPGASAAALALALGGSLLGILPLSRPDLGAWARLALPVPGLASLALTAWRGVGRGALRPDALEAAAVALYGATFVGVFALAGAPGQGPLDLAPGGAGAAGLGAWLLAVGAVAALGAAARPVRDAWPRGGPLAEIVGLALVAVAALAAALSAFARAPGLDPALDALLVLVPALGACVFALQHRYHPGAMHPAVLLGALAGVLVARVGWPSRPDLWPTGIAAACALLFVLARLDDHAPSRTRLALWGAALGLVAPAAAAALRGSAPGTPWTGVTLAAGVVAASAHATAGRGLRGLHLPGGACAVAAAAAWFVPAARAPGALALVLGATCGAYLVAGALERRLGRGPEDAHAFAPLEDVSLAAGLLALPLLPLPAAGALAPRASLPAVVVAVALALRAPRDGSRVVTVAGACALAAGAWAASGAVTPGRTTLVGGAVALALALAAAAVRGDAAGDPSATARPLLAAAPLPFAARGRALFGDGLACGALAAAAVTVASAVAWLVAQTEPERGDALRGSLCLVVAGLVAFGSWGFRGLRARGAVLTLAATGLLVVLAALVNRLGRPLAPEVVGRNFLVIVPAVWLAAAGLRRAGPALGRALGRARDGERYHLVPHAGVAALGALLLVDALLVGAPAATRALVTVPPFLLLGALAALALLARSTGRARVLSAGLALALPLGALVAAQRALAGPTLVPLDPPGGRWVREATAAACRALGWLDPAAFLPAGETVASVWLQAARGVAVAGALLAALLAVASAPPRSAWLARVALRGPDLPEEDRLRRDLARLAVAAVVLAAAGGALRPDLAAGAVVLSAGLTLRLAGARSGARAGVLLGALLVHDALAHRAAAHPWWAGPALALVALGVGVALPALARRRGAPEEPARARADAVALGLGVVALAHAFAAGGATDPQAALPRLARNAARGLAATWPATVALPLTAAALTLAVALSATRWRGAIARWWSAAAVVAGALTALAAVAVGSARARPFDPGALYGDLAAREGLRGALVLALAAAAAHALSTLLRGRRDDLARGTGHGRDLALVGVGAALSLAVAARGVADGLASGEAAAAVAFLVAVLAARAERAARHVYAAQVAVVAAYALLSARAGGPVPPAADPVFGLALGFVLVGVTVLARRAGIPPVAAATRRFAGFLPVLVALARGPAAFDREAALSAAGAAAFYATMAVAERSRWFGALAAVAGNVALLALLLAEGLRGAEVFLAPLGLLVLVLVQVFAGTLPRRARRAARLVGGLLLYLPAAVRLAFGLGEAREAGYALVFGAVCLLGVAAGMVLRIRAFLALGTLFLTLDVATTLVNAGLRDHRVGFVVLSLTGLLVLGGTVFATTNRERVAAWTGALRRRLAGWE